MKDLLKKKLKAQNALKTYCALVLFISLSCKIKVVNNQNIENYEVKKFKSRSGFSNISVNVYDYKSKKRTPSWFVVNGISFGVQHEENKIKPLFIETIPNNEFIIEVNYLHMHSVKVKKFDVKKGDSIVINTYLKEDNRH